MKIKNTQQKVDPEIYNENFDRIFNPDKVKNRKLSIFERWKNNIHVKLNKSRK